MSVKNVELERKPIDAATYPSLLDKAVLITGGASGIGAHLVEAYAEQGAKVAFFDIDADAGQTIADQVGKVSRNRPVFMPVNLKDIDSIKSAVSELAEQNFQFIALVNNAGNDDRLAAEEVTPEYWDDRFAVNLRHQFFVTQALIPHLTAAGGGSVINMGSNSWMQNASGLICYTTAKSAIEGLTRCLAKELGERRIRVNSIAPGWILTERQLNRAKAIYPDKFNDYLTRQCLKEFLLPPDVARMALWLSADDSRLVTGQTFVVDGGVV